MLLCAACEPSRIETTPTPVPVLETVWGAPTAVTWAPSFDTPALAVDGLKTLVGAFELINDTPTLVIYRDGVRSRSNITAVNPYELALFAATDLGSLAFWLDTDSGGLQRLYAARLNDVAYSERGAIQISSGAVTRYAAAAMPDNSYWAVWSAPASGESTLVGSRLDSLGRPRSAQTLRSDSDYPALAVTNNGGALLYWLDGERLNLFGGEITDSGLTRVGEIPSGSWTRTITDQLLRLEVGIDNTHAYVFWQVRSGLGLTEVWMKSTTLSNEESIPVVRLAVTRLSERVQTGFNHGTAFSAMQNLEGQRVTWLQPASGQNETLPASGMIDSHLTIIYFQAGRVVGSQTVAALDGELIAPPRVATDDNRDLVVAWWMPDNTAESVLYLVDSRP